MLILERIISLVIGYFFGIFATGYFYAKAKKVDIRNVGSGNTGSTNTLRSLGIKAGAITLLGDCFKCILAIVVVGLIFHKNDPQFVKILQLYAGLGAIIGHNHPFYLNFKGGKGIACTAGFIIAICPYEVPVCLFLFIAIVAITRYVSLGSIVVAISFFVQTLIFGYLGWFALSGRNLVELYAVSAFIMCMALIRHRSNIVRLIKGTENKIGSKGKQNA